MSTEPTIAVPLADGRWVVLTTGELTTGLERAAGVPALAVTPNSAPGPSAVAERWLNSRELAAFVGIGDTTLEAMAARAEIPSLKVGKALRFLPSEVVAALRVKQAQR